MSKSVTRLEAILARCAAATPPPWIWDDYYPSDDPSENGPPDPCFGDLRAENMDVNGPTSGMYHPAVIVTDLGTYPPHGADRAFIAQAREDLPWLAALVQEAACAIHALLASPPTSFNEETAHQLGLAVLVRLDTPGPVEGG